MKNKLYYFYLTLFFFLLISPQSIKAKEYCNLYKNNELHETIELPFYYYILKRTPIFSASMPDINYSKETSYIDSLTKCELINTTITYNILELTDAEVIDYSNNEIFLSDYTHFSQAKIKENGAKIKGLSTTKDEEPPSIYGYQEKYITNINNPIDLSLLISYFSAYDNFDGNISNKIEIKYEEYTQNLNKTGTYPIILSVQDAAQNLTSITFYIQIIDTTPPILEGNNYFTSYLSLPLTIEEIQTELTAYDNADNNLTSQIFVCLDNYTKNKKSIGIYNIFFCVYDNSNNLSNEFEVKIEIKDDIPPILEGLNYFISKLSSPLTINEIMYSLAATDNGKDISDSIFIINDHYSNYQNTLGEKEIYFQAIDQYNNISEPFKVTINLIDDISPQIFGLNIFTSYLSNPLSTTYIKQQLSAIDNFYGNITSDIKIINDSYSPNINNKGTFYITLQVEDASNNKSEEFKVTIKNIDDIPPKIEGPTSLKYKLENKPSLQTILSQFSATDNIDGITNLEIVNEDYSQSIKTGIFYIELSSKDNEGNISAPYLAKIDIVDELIEVNEISLVLPSSTLYTLNQINSLINLSNDYTLIEDTYSNNYYSEGNYFVIYKIKNDIQLKINITVYSFTSSSKEDTTTELTAQKKETFINKIKSFFSNLFNKIKNFFKNIFTLNIYLKNLQYRFYFENQQ